MASSIQRESRALGRLVESNTSLCFYWLVYPQSDNYMLGVSDALDKRHAKVHYKRQISVKLRMVD